MSLKIKPLLLEGPSQSAVDLDLAKQHLNIEHSDFDDLIKTYISAAEDYLSGYDGILSRVLMAQKWRFTFGETESGPDNVFIPFGPLISVDAITIDDVAFAGTTSTETEICGIRVTLDQDIDGKCIVDATMGYATREQIPPAIIAALLLHIGEMFENREISVLGMSITESTQYKSLIAPYKRHRV